MYYIVDYYLYLEQIHRLIQFQSFEQYLNPNILQLKYSKH